MSATLASFMLEWGSAEAHPSVTMSCAARIVIEPFCVRTVGDRGGRMAGLGRAWACGALRSERVSGFGEVA